MRFILLDPGAVTTVGHHFNYLQTLSHELDRRGIENVSYAHLGVAESEGKLHAKPHFRVSPYATISRDRICGPIENFIAHSEGLFQDLCRLSKNVLDDKNIAVCFPSVHWNQIYGIACWLATLPKDRRPPVSMLLGHAAGVAIDGDQHVIDKGIAPYYRLGYNRLRNLQYPRLTVAAYGAKLAEEHRFLAGMDIVQHPLHFAGEDVVLLPRRPPDGRLKLLYAGDARGNKGFHLLPEILSGIVSATNHIDITVQISGYVSLLGLNSVADRIDVLARKIDRIKLVTGYQDRAAYLEMFNDADIVLLPYQAEAYRSLTSGVLTEALFLGRPLVTPNESFLADQVRQLGDCGTFFDRHEPDSIVAATLALAANFPIYAERACKASRVWRSMHGTGHLVDFLLELANERDDGQPRRQED